MLWHESDTSQRATDVGEVKGKQYSVDRSGQRVYSHVHRIVVMRTANVSAPLVSFGAVRLRCW
jgi:hypothetical protein